MAHPCNPRSPQAEWEDVSSEPARASSRDSETDGLVIYGYVIPRHVIPSSAFCLRHFVSKPFLLIWTKFRPFVLMRIIINFHG